MCARERVKAMSEAGKKKKQISPLALERDEKRDAENCEGQGGSCSWTVIIQPSGLGSGL